jgi:hypothetical protein
MVVYTSDSDSEDDLLSYTPFTPSSQKSQSQRDEQSSSNQAADDGGDSDGSPSKQTPQSQASPLDPDTQQLIASDLSLIDSPDAATPQPEEERKALSWASLAEMPDVQSPADLVWVPWGKNGAKIKREPARLIPYPYTECAFSEIMNKSNFQKLIAAKGSSKDAVVQFIQVPCVTDYMVIGKSGLLPYDEGNAAVQGEEVSPSSSSSPSALPVAAQASWSVHLMKEYVKFKSKDKSKTKRAEALGIKSFSERILVEARAREIENKRRILEEGEASIEVDDLDTSSSSSSSSSNKNTTPAFKSTPITDNHSPSSDDEPYSQRPPSDDDDGDDSDTCVSSFSNTKKTEPIRPHDMIQYYSPMYPAGSKIGVRKATVLGVDPKKKSNILELSNGEILPPDTQVSRISVIFKGRMSPWRGKFRPIADFKLQGKRMPDDERDKLGFGPKNNSNTRGGQAKKVMEEGMKVFRKAIGVDEDEDIGGLMQNNFRGGGKAKSKTKGKAAEVKGSYDGSEDEGNSSLDDFVISKQDKAKEKKNAKSKLKKKIEEDKKKIKKRKAEEEGGSGEDSDESTDEDSDDDDGRSSSASVSSRSKTSRLSTIKSSSASSSASPSGASSSSSTEKSRLNTSKLSLSKNKKSKASSSSSPQSNDDEEGGGELPSFGKAKKTPTKKVGGGVRL